MKARIAALPGRLGPLVAPGFLASSLVGLTVGALLHLAGLGSAGDATWTAVGSLGALYSASKTAVTLWHRRLGVDVIALAALVGALGVGERLAASVIAVMLATGSALESWAAGRARRELRALLERAPRSARRYRGETLETIDLHEVASGDLLMVAPGEVVPVDGTIESDGAVFDESALTGEALPVDRATGTPVLSGVLNVGRPLDLRATASASQSTYAGITRLAAEAASRQVPFVRLADRYALWFLGLTAALAGAAWGFAGASRAVAVLVVATPCPLILAAPIAFVSGLSRAASRGIVVKGGGVLERLARCSTLVVDKTGTLTSGQPRLTAILAAGPHEPEVLLGLAASLDQASSHPLAGALVHGARERERRLSLPTEVEEVAGQGIRGRVGAHRVALGKARWLGIDGSAGWVRAARREARLNGASAVFVGVDDAPGGVFLFEDELRRDTARTLRRLRDEGIARIVMLTGDRMEAAERVGAMVGFDQIVANCRPEEKLAAVEAEKRLAPTVMVGDGINDAPALALADVGVAMGARGATASSETADIVITADRLERLAEAKSLARRTRRIAIESVFVGMAMSLVAMGWAAAGLLAAVWGALLQEGIDVVAILSSLRALRFARSELRIGEADLPLFERFRTEHSRIWADLERLRQAADHLGADGSRSLDEVREVHRLLVEEVAPHEQAEEREFYPALNRLLGGQDPTGTMSRAHAEIAEQIRRLGQLLDDVGPGGPDVELLTELRRTLYGLHAILSLHTAQEEEGYLSLTDMGDVADRA